MVPVGHRREQLTELLVERPRNERRADVEVARKPAARQRIDERNRYVRKADHDDQQRNQEPKGKP